MKNTMAMDISKMAGMVKIPSFFAIKSTPCSNTHTRHYSTDGLTFFVYWHVNKEVDFDICNHSESKH